jgi:hypothetical protein
LQTEKPRSLQFIKINLRCASQVKKIENETKAVPRNRKIGIGALLHRLTDSPSRVTAMKKERKKERDQGAVLRIHISYFIAQQRLRFSLVRNKGKLSKKNQ